MRRTATLMLAGIVAFSFGAASAQEVTVSLPGTVTATAGEEIVLPLVIEINDPWYIYTPQDKRAGADFIPLKIEFEPGDWVQYAAPDYPGGTPIGVADVYFGPDVTIEQKIRIRPRTKAGPYIAVGYVTYQACKEGFCLPPQTDELHVDVTVAE